MPREEPKVCELFQLLLNSRGDSPSHDQSRDEGICSALNAMPPSMVEAALPLLVRDHMRQLRALRGERAIVDGVNLVRGYVECDPCAVYDSLMEQTRQTSKLPPSEISQILISNRMTLLSKFESAPVTEKLVIIHKEFCFLSKLLVEDKQSLPEQYYCEFFKFETLLPHTVAGLFVLVCELPGVLKLSDVVEVLLKLRLSGAIYERILVNLPQYFWEILHCVLRVKLDASQEPARSVLVAQLTALDPSSVDYVISHLARKYMYPELLVDLLCEKSERAGGSYREPVLHFLLEVFVSEDKILRRWMIGHLREMWKTKSAFVLQLKDTLQRLQLSCQSSDTPYDTIVLTVSYLKLYCCLRVLCNWRFDDDNRVLVALMTHRFEESDLNSSYVKIVLSTLLVIPQLILNSEHEKHMLDFLKTLKARCSGKPAYSQTLALIVIFLMQSQPERLTQLVDGILGIDLPVKFDNLNRVKAFFTKLLFTENDICQICALMPVTENLSSESPLYLPIDCIMSLVGQNCFEKNHISISDWVLTQVKHCCTPIHKEIIPLVERLVVCVIQPLNPEKFRERPWSESELTEVFENPFSSVTNQGKLVPQLLMLYYLLFYKETLLVRTKHMSESERRHSFLYSSKLTELVPVRFLLTRAEQSQGALSDLYPRLLNAASNQFPQLFQFHGAVTLRWFFSQSDRGVTSHGGGQGEPLPSTAKLIYQFEDPARNSKDCLRSLQALCGIGEAEMAAYIDVFVSLLPNLLLPGVPLRILTLSLEVWNRFNSALPRLLWTKTVNALQASPEFKVSFSCTDLTLDPLAILKCDPRILRCPVLLVIVLRVLSAFLIASRVHLSDQIALHPTGLSTSASNQVSDAEKEDLRAALITAQESTAVQMLLEACLDDDSSDAQWQLSNQREVQGIICSHIHQMFLEDPNLMKLVHFQTYSHALLPITTTNIASIHICLDFIPELLSQPDESQQVFAIDLLSHLVIRYTIAKAYSTAKLAVQVASTMADVLPREKLYGYMLRVLPALERISKALPPLSKDCVSILYRLADQSWASISCEMPSIGHFPPFSKTVPPESDITNCQTDSGGDLKKLYDLSRATFVNIVQSTANPLL